MEVIMTVILILEFILAFWFSIWICENINNTGKYDKKDKRKKK